MNDITDHFEYLRTLIIEFDPFVAQWGNSYAGRARKMPGGWLILGRLVIPSPAFITEQISHNPRNAQIWASWRSPDGDDLAVGLVSHGAPWSTTYGTAMQARISTVSLGPT